MIDRQFKEALKDYSLEPKPELWDRLEQRLDSKKKRIWPYWAAAILFLGLTLPWAFGPDAESQYVPRDSMAKLEGAEPAGEEVFELPEKWKAPAQKQLVMAQAIPVKKEEKVIEEQPKKKKVIVAFVRPLSPKKIKPQAVQAIEPSTNTELKEEPVKEKMQLDDWWKALLAFKNGDLELPKNLSISVPKPELFASK